MNLSENRYAIILDNATQWFSYIVFLDGFSKCKENYILSSNISNDYLSNIYNRPMSFSNLEIDLINEQNKNWGGWWISAYDFERIKQMIKLFPSVLKYKQLGELEKLN